MKAKRTDELLSILCSTHPARIGDYLETQQRELLEDEYAFSAFFKQAIRAHGRTQRQVFLQADFQDQYGYRLVSGERHTSQRDYILRLCLAGGLTLEEVQQALRLYGMAALYPRRPRDAVIISAISARIHDWREVNALLEAQGLSPLKHGGREE